MVSSLSFVYITPFFVMRLSTSVMILFCGSVIVKLPAKDVISFLVWRIFHNPR